MKSVLEIIVFITGALVTIFVYSSNQHSLEKETETDDVSILLEPSTMGLIDKFNHDDITPMDSNNQLSIEAALPELEHSSGWLRNAEEFFGHMAVALLHQPGIVATSGDPMPSIPRPTIPTATVTITAECCTPFLKFDASVGTPAIGCTIEGETETQDPQGTRFGMLK